MVLLLSFLLGGGENDCKMGVIGVWGEVEQHVEDFLEQAARSDRKLSSLANRPEKSSFNQKYWRSQL